jgi:hypothetical protein
MVRLRKITKSINIVGNQADIRAVYLVIQVQSVFSTITYSVIITQSYGFIPD